MNIIKKLDDHRVIPTETCGDFVEILRNGEYEKLDLGIVRNIAPTKGHYHERSDEIYFVLDGEITVSLFDPRDKTRRTVRLTANELCAIKVGTHHKVSAASNVNRICVITVPKWDEEDEHLSEIL